MLEKLFDAHRIRIDSQIDHSHTDLGPGELRQYYEKSLLEVKRRAEEESAGQVTTDLFNTILEPPEIPGGRETLHHSFDSKLPSR